MKNTFKKFNYFSFEMSYLFIETIDQIYIKKSTMNCILEQTKQILIIGYLWQEPCRRSSFSSTFMKKHALHVDAIDEDHVGNVELL